MSPDRETELDDLVEVFKALGNPARIRIMQWLRDPDQYFAEYGTAESRRTVGVCVTHIRERAGLAQSTVSSYMATLERAGLVRSTRVGKWTHFRRDEEKLAEVARQWGRTL